MVALYREGRRAEALRRANDFRTLLREEMGLDPSPAVLAVETQILADDTALMGRSEPSYAMREWRRVVDDPTRLVGRDDDLVRIDEAIGTAPLVTLVGPVGEPVPPLPPQAAATHATANAGSNRWRTLVRSMPEN